MENNDDYSEIRNSVIEELRLRRQKRDYFKYLTSVSLTGVRCFQNARIDFDFPVTALIGPNGGGKSTILGAAGLAYYSKTDNQRIRPDIVPEDFFQKCRVGDRSMEDWLIRHEGIDREIDRDGLIRAETVFQNGAWVHTYAGERKVAFISINRTVPAIEKTPYKKKLRHGYQGFVHDVDVKSEKIEDISTVRREAERVLGKSFDHLSLLRIQIEKIPSTRRRLPIPESARYGIKKLPSHGTQRVQRSETSLFVMSNSEVEYSEFNFGSGEASVIRMIAETEGLPKHSLVLIEEIENGLHPVAVRRLTEYFINVAHRKGLQVIFTTHSDHALTPLPGEAIWATFNGQVQQGKLSIAALRSITGEIPKRLGIFVEDEFAKLWVEAILRENLNETFDSISVYAIGGDGTAVKAHFAHLKNPTTHLNSICILDGDSRHSESESKQVYKLPGECPEAEVFTSVLKNLRNNIQYLTFACQRTTKSEEFIANAIRTVAYSNRDAHLLFAQIARAIGSVPVSIVQGAFISVWIQENPVEVGRIVNLVQGALPLDGENLINR